MAASATLFSRSPEAMSSSPWTATRSASRLPIGDESTSKCIALLPITILLRSPGATHGEAFVLRGVRQALRPGKDDPDPVRLLAAGYRSAPPPAPRLTVLIPANSGDFEVLGSWPDAMSLARAGPQGAQRLVAGFRFRLASLPPQDPRRWLG